MSNDRATIEAHLRKQVDAFWVEVVKGNFSAAKSNLTGLEASITNGTSSTTRGLRKSPKEEDEISKSRNFSLLDTDLVSPMGDMKFETSGESSIFDIDINSLWLSSKASGVSIRRISSDAICCGLIKSSTGKREDRRCMLAKDVCTTKSHKENQLEDFEGGVVCAEIGVPKSFITGCVFRYVDYPDTLLNKICPDYTGSSSDIEPPFVMPALYWRIVYEFSPALKRLSTLLGSAVGEGTAKQVLLDSIRPAKVDAPIDTSTLDEILEELDSLRFASINQAELLENLQTDFDSYRTEMEELLDDKDQVILQLSATAFRKAMKDFVDSQKPSPDSSSASAPVSAPDGTTTAAPWKTSVAEGFTALKDLESKVDGNAASLVASIKELEEDMKRLGQKISSSGVSFGDTEFNGIDDCQHYLDEHISKAYNALKLSLPKRFNIGVMVCPLSVLFSFGSLVMLEIARAHSSFVHNESRWVLTKIK